jgi:16S rRNA (guanine966-N2)-methyltransferase
VRPTSDRAREAVFNILEHGKHARGEGSPIPGAQVLDAFAGSGALGIEALSRGAAHATFLDTGPEALAAIRRNLAALGGLDRATVVRTDCLFPPAALAPCGIVFLDPPYGEGLAEPALIALGKAGWIANGAVCIVELSRDDAFAPPEGFAALDERRYGSAQIVILQACERQRTKSSPIAGVDFGGGYRADIARETPPTPTLPRKGGGRKR